MAITIASAIGDASTVSPDRLGRSEGRPFRCSRAGLLTSWRRSKEKTDARRCLSVPRSPPIRPLDGRDLPRLRERAPRSRTSRVALWLVPVGLWANEFLPQTSLKDLAKGMSSDGIFFGDRP